jgi:prolyl 4-hydroxylase
MATLRVRGIQRTQTLWLLLPLLLQGSTTAAVSFSRGRSSSTALAFAGGGFGSNNKKKAAPSTRSNKRRPKGFSDPDFPLAKTVNRGDHSDAPVLDKWGLPPPTADDIFPRPDPTTIVPARAVNHKYSLTEIVAALASYVDLPGVRLHFDEDGVERHPPAGQPPVRLSLVHESPPVLVLDDFLTPAECRAVQAVPVDVESTAVQVDSATFSSTLAHSTRTSTSWFCHYAQVPTVLAKAQHLLGGYDDDRLVACMEEPQIVRYRTGQEFSWHYDEVPAAQLANGGQRVATLLFYLNTVQRGGGTVFRDLSSSSSSSSPEPLTVQPQQGRLCLFFPAPADGTPDERTLHKGQVAEEEKQIIQIWLHQRPYTAVLPPRNSQADAGTAMAVARQRLGYDDDDNNNDNPPS